MTQLEKTKRAERIARRTGKPHFWLSEEEGWLFAGTARPRPGGAYWLFVDHLDRVYTVNGLMNLRASSYPE